MNNPLYAWAVRISIVHSVWQIIEGSCFLFFSPHLICHLFPLTSNQLNHSPIILWLPVLLVSRIHLLLTVSINKKPTNVQSFPCFQSAPSSACWTCLFDFTVVDLSLSLSVLLWLFLFSFTPSLTPPFPHFLPPPLCVNQSFHHWCSFQKLPK